MTQYSGMWTSRQQLQAQGAGNWPSQYPPDAKFNYVTLLLNGDGVNAAQNNTFLDSSTNNFTITRNGNTTQGSFSPYGSNWSNYFPGTAGQAISMPTNTALDLTGDFTIEFWYYANSFGTNNVLFDTSASGTYDSTMTEAYVPSNGSIILYVAGTFSLTTAAGVLALGTWYHIAFTRSANTWNIWVNGVSVASYTGAATFSTGYSWRLGDRVAGAGSANYPIRGYLSNFRVVKGTALYSNTFTPPTTPLTAISGTSLLTCQSNRFIDNSTVANVLTVGNANDSVQRFNPFGETPTYSASTIGGSAYFDGAGDSLVTPSTGQFTAAGDFTISCWVYPTSFAAIREYMGPYNADTAGAGNWELQQEISGQVTFFYDGPTNKILSSSILKLNSWTYVSAVRSGSTITLYFNGVSQGTATFSSSFGSATKANYIGDYSGGGYPMVGWLSDIRLVAGSAITTVPTAPTTAVSGTGLLLSMTNGAIYDSAMINNLETVGNAQISTSVVKYGTGSIAFDGTGDYLSAPDATQWAFGAGNFTIEAWVYPTGAFASYTTIVAQSNNGTASAQSFDILVNSSGAVLAEVYIGATAYSITSSATLSLNTWAHVALVRSGSTFTLYINGTASGTPITNSGALNDSTYALTIGAETTPFRYWNGYIDDLRITKGYARYTNTFTPPTQSLPTYGPSNTPS